MRLKCINHGCSLKEGCRNYMNKAGDSEYIRPKIFYDDLGARIECEKFEAFGHRITVAQSKMNNDIIIRRKQKRALGLAQKAKTLSSAEILKEINELICR